MMRDTDLDGNTAALRERERKNAIFESRYERAEEWLRTASGEELAEMLWDEHECPSEIWEFITDWCVDHIRQQYRYDLIDAKLEEYEREGVS